jgi:hypothetical protein
MYMLELHQIKAAYYLLVFLAVTEKNKIKYIILKAEFGKFIKNFFTVPFHLVSNVVLAYSLVKGHIDWREYGLIVGLMVIFSVVGATKPLWK